MTVMDKIYGVIILIPYDSSMATCMELGKNLHRTQIRTCTELGKAHSNLI